MPPRVGSRHSFTFGVHDADGVLHLTEREPYRYKAHTDNRVHVVVQGDTLWDLAGRYFAPLPGPAASGGPSPTSSPTPSWTRRSGSKRVGASSSPRCAC